MPDGMLAVLLKVDLQQCCHLLWVRAKISMEQLNKFRSAFTVLHKSVTMFLQACPQQMSSALGWHRVVNGKGQSNMCYA